MYLYLKFHLAAREYMDKCPANCTESSQEKKNSARNSERGTLCTLLIIVPPKATINATRCVLCNERYQVCSLQLTLPDVIHAV